MFQENLAGKIVIFKLLSGEQIVTRVHAENKDSYQIKMPFLIQPVVNSMTANPNVSLAFIPYVLGTDKKTTICLYKHAIAAMAKPEKEMEAEYIRSTSNIIVASDVPNILKE